ncbi:MAG: putative lipopolysaccharide heptosyltransferase III [Verrucomicrobia bacterium]|nr:putative lipopolysaccharide heptosyltransferase III [Verrucomicrobiota bacterium]
MSYGNYPDLTGTGRILVIKLRHLGDVLLSAPVFSYLKKVFPDAQIDGYIWEEAKPMLDGHPAISQLILHNRKWKKLPFISRMKNELHLLRHIRSQKYDLIINLTEGDRGLIAATASGAKVRVGIDPKGKKRKLLTHIVKPCPTYRHTVERDLDALRRIGLFPEMDERELYFHIPQEAHQWAKERMGDTPFVVVHAPSRWRFKCLPPHLMAKVIDQLGEKVVLTGSPSERDFVQEVANLTSKEVINVAGETSLKEMGALIQLSKGLITVDSVALHMASALKVPVVALFGPTSEKNWGPWQNPQSVVVSQNRECRPCHMDGCGGSKRSDCLWTLTASEIVDAFEKLLTDFVSSLF